MREKTYHFYGDPGHGWLRVSRTELKRLGMESQITPCSFVSPSGKWIYLEEDCDAPLFIQAVKAEGHDIRLVPHHTDGDSHIRSYRCYQGAVMA